MQKVVLINPSQHTKYPQPPMGLALLGAILERAGHEVKIIDANFDCSALPYIWQPDVVGITAMTPTITSALNIARRVRLNCPDAKIILGGVHATLLPEETMDSCPELDVAVKGEGDAAILEVLKFGIKGIYESDACFEMDGLPFLGYHLLPWQEYRPHPPHGRALPWIAMLTSRGCPYHCSYCSKGVFGNKFRAQTPYRVVAEICYHQYKMGAKEVAFYDDVFTLDQKRAYAIADEILRKNVKVCWTCETRANLVSKELLRHMKRAGCYSISYGIESGSQKILDIIGKGISLGQSEEAVRLTKEVGMQAIGYFMIGSPDETPETIGQTIRFAKELKLDYAQFAVTIPFPGTTLFEYYKNGDNNLNVPWENFVYAGVGNKTSPMFDSESLSRDDIERWVSRAYREFYLRPSYAWQRLTGVRSFGDARVLMKGISMLRGM